MDNQIDDNSDDNNRDNDKGKTKPQQNIPSSPDTVATCSSSTGDSNDDDDEQVDALIASPATQRRQRNLDLQIRQLGIAIGASAVILVLSVVPMPILILCASSSSLFMALLFKCYQRILLQYQTRILHGPGLAPYLPERIRHQLVDNTLHDLLTDDTLFREYGYLVLYFLPGLSPAQIDAYVDRLAPRHQQVVRRRGLGHLLGPTFMNLIVGGQGNRDSSVSSQNYGVRPRDHPMPQLQPPTSLSSIPPPTNLVTRRQYGDQDENSATTGDLALAISSSVEDSWRELRRPGCSRDDDENRSNDQHTEKHKVMIVSATPDEASDSRKNDEDDKHATETEAGDDDGEDLGAEGTVVLDAVGNSILWWFDMAYHVGAGTLASRTYSYINFARRNLWIATSAVAVLSISAGSIGWFLGTYENPLRQGPATPSSTPIPSIRLSLPSSSFVWSTTIASTVATAGLMLMNVVQGSSSPSTTTPAAENGDNTAGSGPYKGNATDEAQA